MAGRVHERPRRMNGLLNDRRQLDASPAQLDAVVRNATEVEQVVDQPDELRQLPIHRLDRAAAPLPCRRRRASAPRACC